MDVYLIDTKLITGALEYGKYQLYTNTHTRTISTRLVRDCKKSGPSSDGDRRFIGSDEIETFERCPLAMHYLFSVEDFFGPFLFSSGFSAHQPLIIFVSEITKKCIPAGSIRVAYCQHNVIA